MRSLGKFLLIFWAFTLTLHEQLNNFMLICLVLYVLINLRKFTAQLNDKGSKDILIGFIPAILLVPRIWGVFFEPSEIAMQELVRALPLVLYPLIFWFFSKTIGFQELEKIIFQGLFSGILVFMLICEVAMIYEWASNNEPLEYLWRWRHMNFQFTKILDTHPAYAGMFVFLIYLWSIFKRKFASKYLGWLTVILFIFLIQLLARNALVFFILTIGGFLFYEKKWKLLSVIIGIMVIFSVAIVTSKSDYLKKKFTIVNSNGSFMDQRFIRLGVSYSIFKENIVTGAGPESVVQKRKALFKENNDTIAFQKGYNSHNQLLDYLSKSGLIGGVSFVLTLALLVIFAWKHNNYMGLWLIITFLGFTITESVLERSLGVKYFSLISCLILYKEIGGNGYNLLNGSRA